MASPGLNFLLRTSFTVPVFAGTALASDFARACSPYYACAGLSGWLGIEPLTTQIPTDGVLLLKTSQVNGATHESIDLTVTHDGQPVDGALTPSPDPGVLLWRPAAPLPPDAIFHVTGTATNSYTDPDRPECGQSSVPIDFTFATDAGPAAPLVAPKVSAVEAVEVWPVHDLDALACCDGVIPSFDSCGASWPEGQCASTRGTGYLRVALTIDDGLPPATAGMVLRRIEELPHLAPRFDGALELLDDQPFCARVALENVATGERVVGDEQCFGQDRADELGEQPLDPVAAIGANCPGGLHTCELADGYPAWDPNRCSGVDGDGHGCNCDAGAPAPPAALVLLGGAAFVRRRRRRR